MSVFSEDEVKEARIIIGGNCSIAHSNPPLVIVNDEIIPQGTLPDLMPKNIQSMSILKGEEATKQYGKDGENGVVLINTSQSYSSLKEN